MSRLTSLGEGPNQLGSLAQSARMKHMNQAKWTLIIIGVLTALLNGFMLAQSQKEVDDLIRAGQLGAADAGTVLGLVRVIYGGALALGVVFIILGALVNRFPVPTTIAGLVLYLASTALFMLLDPSSIAKGIVIKVIIIYGLVRAVNAAIAYKKESSLRTGFKPPSPGLGADL